MKAAIIVISAVLVVVVAPLRAHQAQNAPTDQGVDSVEVIKATATVEKIDLEKRRVTLLMDDGKKKTFKVDKSVQNLGQVGVGDTLKMSYTEEIIILVGKTNGTLGAAAAQEVGVAPKGAKPGVVMADESVLTAKILAVDAQNHRLTLEEPDGGKKTIKVSKNFTGLNQMTPGQTVDMLLAESLVIEIVK